MKVRVAELVGGLSLATDMGAGQPLQSAIVATILATRMAERLGLGADEQRATFYAAILRFIGCSSVAPEAAQMGAGDDMSLNYAFSMCDMTDARQVEESLDRHWAKNADPKLRREVIRSMSQDLSLMGAAAGMHCAQAVLLSRRFPIGDRVPDMLGYMYDRWDGVGSAHAGDEIPIPARLCCLAADTAVMIRSLGKRTALELILPRKGGQFCPECTQLLERDADSLLDGLDAPSCWEPYLDAEPGSAAILETESIEKACSAYADFGDQKSGYFLGHSRQLAQLAFLAGDAAGLEPGQYERLRLSALLHDVGRAGVPAGLWEKPTALSAHERQIVESHAKYTETILQLAPALGELVGGAASVHERVDRTGYPRAATLDTANGILAAADVYQALTHDRPWRQAYSKDAAAQMLLDQARDGKLPRQAVVAVLDAAGHGKRTADGAYPAGLTRREVEVLALLAQGHGTKQIGDRLGMAAKTAENHVGHVYDKTGARGRAAAALYAIEHGLHEFPLAPEADA